MDTALIKKLVPATQTVPHGTPPRPVLIALATLLGPDADLPEELCTSAWLTGEDGQKLMTWQVVAVTERTVVLVSASRKSGSSWALGFGDQKAERITAWSAPMNALARVDIAEVALWQTRSFGEEDWNANLAYAVTFANGDRLALPGHEAASYDREAVERVIAKLLDHL